MINSKNNEQPFVSHVNDLRMLIIRICIFTIIPISICLCFAEDICNLLIADNNIFVINITEGIVTKIKVACMSGIIIALPYIIANIISYLKQATTSQEYRTIFIISILSILTTYISIYLAMKYTIVMFFQAIQAFDLQIQHAIRISSYIDFIIGAIILTIIIVNMPVILASLLYTEILNPYTIRQYRKQYIIAAFIVSAVVTPPDPISQICFAMYILLIIEICIIIFMFTNKQK